MSARNKTNPNIRVLAGDSFKQMDSGRVREYRLRWSKNPETHESGEFPIHLDVESTSVCNLKCRFCATAKEKYPPGYMSAEMFRRIIDEGGEKGLCSVKLNFRGEPLLHSGITDFIKYAKKKGVIDVFFNTNATMLTEETGRKLIDAGLDRLIVSFEGYDKKVYESNRIGADFDRVVSNVRNFVGLKRRMKSAGPVLRLQTVELADMPGYLEKYRKFWSGYADEITCIDLRDEGADFSGLEDGKWECPYLWRRLCITWDGDIYTCPFVNKSPDAYEWPGFGNVKNVSIGSVWSGTAMGDIRKAHTGGVSHRVEPCKRCSYRGTEITKKHDKT